MIRAQSKTALLRASALFRMLPEPLLAEIAVGATLRQSGSVGDELLFRLGEASQGRVFLTIADDQPGPLLQVSFDDPIAQAPRRGYRLVGGEILGDIELLLSGLSPALPARCVSVRLLREQRLLEMPAEIICQAAAQCEPFRRRLVRDAARRMLAQLTDRTLADSRSPDTVLARKLLDFLDDFGSVEGNTGVLRDRMTQQQIADLLGMSLRLFSLRISEWSQRGLIETVPFALADLDRIERIAASGEAAAPVAAASAFADAMEAIRLGLPARGGRIASDALAIWPDNPALIYAQALSALRTGARENAVGLLRRPDLAWDGSIGSLRQRLRQAWARSVLPRIGGDDEAEETAAAAAFAALENRLCQDVGGLHGRLAKQDALAMPPGPMRRQALVAAAELYAAVDAGSPNAYCAINAATLFRLGGQSPEATRLAGQTLSQAKGQGYWDLVTRGEALLVVGRPGEAVPCFGEAAHIARLGEIGSTRGQLSQLAHAGIVGAHEALIALHPGSPLCFSGMILRPSDGSDAEVEAAAHAMRGEIERWLSQNPAPLAFTGLAAGADILFAEALAAADVPYEVVLPFRSETFAALSVAIGGAGWRDRFERRLADARRVTELWQDEVAKSAVERHFQRANRHMAGEAIFAAHQLSVAPRLLTLSPGDSGPAGSLALARDFAALGHPVAALVVPALRRRSGAPGPLADPFAAVIFAFDPGGNEEVAVARLFARHGLEPRRQKNRLLHGSLAVRSVADALAKASSLARDGVETGLALGIICDFGPVLRRGDAVDREAMGRLEAAQGLAAAEPGGVFATTALVMPAIALGAPPVAFVEIAFGLVPGRTPKGEAARRLFRYRPPAP